jgi:hypothetical protein
MEFTPLASIGRVVKHRPQDELENLAEQAAKSSALSLSFVRRDDVVAPTCIGRRNVSPANLDDSVVVHVLQRRLVDPGHRVGDRPVYAGIRLQRG